MGQVVKTVDATTFSAPYQGGYMDTSFNVALTKGDIVVGVDVTETTPNYYQVSLVTMNNQYASPGTETRFFRMSSLHADLFLNDDAMYLGNAQIKTFSTANVKPDPFIYTLHFFEEST